MQTLSTVSEDLLNLCVYGSNYVPPFLDDKFQTKTLTEIFTALPYTYGSGGQSAGLGSSIKIAIYSASNTLFDDLKALIGVNQLQSGYLEITKYGTGNLARGMITYNIGSIIYNCRIVDNVFGSCYKIELTAI